MNSLASIANIIKRPASRIAILYGSHTGNTEMLAKNLKSELEWRLGLDASLSCLSWLDFKDLSKLDNRDTLLMLMSTYGEGEPNRNTRMLWESIFEKPIKTPLSFNYSVLARGSTLYGSTYALAGRSVDSRLQHLGASQLTPCGLQDKVDPNSEDQFFQWKENVMRSLIEKYHLDERPYHYYPSASVHEIHSDANKENIEPLISNLLPGAKNVPLKVRSLGKTDRDYIYAELNLPGYSTGDYATIWPSNSKEVVDKFLSAMLGDTSDFTTADTPLEVTENGASTVTTLRCLAERTLDINRPPERELLLKLAALAPTKTAERHLRSIIESPITQSLTDILLDSSGDTPWLQSLPISALVDMFPVLQPRRYSISTSSLESPEWAGISAVVEHDAQSGFWGVATGQMYSQANETRESYITATHEPLEKFRLPADPKTPLILVGVGTGFAPFRAFIRERALQNHSGPILLFTGTRTPEDLVHGEEMSRLIAENDNLRVQHIPAYSRVSKDHPDYGYFPEKIKAHGDDVYDFIKNGAHIYICGDILKVKRGVRDTVASIFSEKLQLSPKEGQQKWKKLKKSGRLHIELW